MKSESERELLRQLEEPLNCECRNYPLPEDKLLVTMLDSPYYPPYCMDMLHYHNCMEIGVCLSGHGQVRLGSSDVWSFSPGSIVVAPKGVYHNQQNPAGPVIHWRYLVINEAALLKKAPERYQPALNDLFDAIAGKGLFLENTGERSDISYIVQLMYDLRRMDGSESSTEIELLLLLLLTMIARYANSLPVDIAAQQPDTHQRQPVEPALTFVYEHYKEDIQVSDLARSCSMSESYFRKQFQRIMGMSPMEYVNRYRVHRAMNLLRTTSDSIQNIAVRAGFSSIAAFNRNFKQYASVSPGEWRRSRMNK